MEKTDAQILYVSGSAASDCMRLYVWLVNILEYHG
jgi:hypothetical protein